MFITVVGEDLKFCAQLEQLLLSQNHKVTSVPDLSRVPDALQALPPHLLVVASDQNSGSVASLLRLIRDDAGLRRLPILCVNPRGGSADGVTYLDSGADDFINRPFNPQIFMARVRTLLRRRIWSGDLEADEVTLLNFGPLTMNLLSRQALMAGSPVILTRLEFDLLAFLVRNSGQVFKRQELLENVWNYPHDVETRTLDKHVESLRRKLGAFGACVHTVHGVGYRMTHPTFGAKHNKTAA